MEGKHTPEEVRQRFRDIVHSAFFLRSGRRLKRYIPSVEEKKKSQEIISSFRQAFLVQKAALKFANLAPRPTNQKEVKELDESVKKAGFGIDSSHLASIVSKHDLPTLNDLGGLCGICDLISSSQKDGIKTSSLSDRQNIYGYNRYTEKPSRNFWSFVWDALHDLTLIILIVCAVVSLVVGYFTEGLPKGLFDGLGILISILLVVVVTAVSDYKQSLQFKKLDKEKKKILVQVTRDGCRQKISIFDLVVGDVVHLSIGDQVPTDGLYISGYSLSIDESSLTGESDPIDISKEQPFLLSGTKVQDGSGKMLVTAVGMKTEWGKLMDTLNEEVDDETPLQVKLNGVATIIGKIGLLFSILTFIILLLRYILQKIGEDDLMNWSLEDAKIILDYFATAVTIIVVAVPEGLPLAVTLSLAFAMKKLMDDKALVRHLSACETMGSSNCICTDKTGTLTTNHMIVNKIWTCEKTKVLGNKDSVNEFKSSVPENVVNALLQCIFLNSGSEVVIGKDGGRNILGNPTECALLEFGLDSGGDFDAYRNDCTIKKVEPFNSVKKKMSVLVSLPNGGMRAFCKGASEIILQICDKIIDGNGNTVPLSEKQINDANKIINTFANEALRTLLVASKDMDKTTNDEIPTDGYTLMAVFGIKDPVRPGVKEAVEACRDAGIIVRMVTGDNIHTARAIAKECSILTDDGVAIEGKDFRDMDSQEMKSLFPKLQVMGRSLPLDKNILVKKLRCLNGDVAAVTGDGTNDAPALHESDIGFAMGISGTEVAKENADVIVMDDNFTTITNVVKWGRAVYINIQKFVQFQLTVNVVALMVNFFSAVITGEAPLTAVQLLWVNMIMDTLGALALATEPPNDEIMKRPPVGRSENFITRIMWRNVIGQSIYQLVVLGVLLFDGKQIFNINGEKAETTLNTFIFNTFVFCQVFNEINSREMEKFNVFRGIFGNWIFSAIVGVTIIFQVIIVEFLGTFASTVPLSWNLWIYSIVIGFLGMPISIVLKCIPVNCLKPNGGGKNDDYQPLPSGPDGV